MQRPAGRFARIAAMVALGLGLFLAWLLWSLPPASRTVCLDAFPAPDPTATETTLRGAFHVHSRWSDGSGTVDEIAAAAAAAGLDFVLLTDHGDATTARPPTYRDGVLVIEGVEISTDGGHYVALGLPAAPYPLGGDPRGVVEDVRRLGGFGVAAHPTSPRPALAWSDWSLPVDGIEWINGDSQWRDDSLPALLRAAGGYWFRAPESLASLLSRPEGALARWDALAADRSVVGFGALDAHARLPLGNDGDGYGGGIDLRFPGYEETFRTLALRVEFDLPLAGDAAADGAALIRQLRAGRTYTAVDALASPVRFTYAGRTSDGSRVRMGERAPPGRDLMLTVSVAGPADATIRLLRNGRVVAEEAGYTLVHAAAGAEPASYRVEVALPGAPGRPPVPWITSNPIYVGGSAATAAAPPTTAVWRPAPGGPWRIERRPDARAMLEETPGGFRFDFSLGDSAATYVAAVRTLPPGSLANALGFRFEVEAAQPMRASLQLRSPDDGGSTVRWRRSFYAGPERRIIHARIDEFVPGWRQVPARPTLAAVDALLLVVDTVNTRPGASGALTVGAVRVGSPPVD